jgi:UDP-N-acetylmuramoylalanine--D-glutamate ligase
VQSILPVSVGKALGRGAYVIDGKLYDVASRPSAEVLDLHRAEALPGAHNWQNAAAAFAACRAIVDDPTALAKAIVSFPGLAHRLQTVARIGRVRFVNDSKATNAAAAAHALAAYDNIFWIAGGRPKEGGIDSTH